jgi:hypothetical protein
LRCPVGRTQPLRSRPDPRWTAGCLSQNGVQPQMASVKSSVLNSQA